MSLISWMGASLHPEHIAASLCLGCVAGVLIGMHCCEAHTIALRGSS